MSSVTLYGIKNCDTVKKARKWLDDRAIEYQFHDFRVDGINQTMLKNFLQEIELDALINKRGRTWHRLDTEQKEFKTKTEAINLMIENPTIIKRPVLKVHGDYFVGFNNEFYKSIDFCA